MARPRPWSSGRRRERSKWLVPGALCCAILTAAAGAAQAQTSEAERRAAADAIFAEGQKLQGVRDYARACPKFEEVTKLLPAKVGAQMTLAACYESAGRLASAKAAYESASRKAAAAGDPRSKEADGKAAALAPRVPRLRIVVPDALRKEPGLAIERDGLAVGEAQWGSEVPVDPGDHTVTISAAGRPSRKESVRVAAGALASFEVPAFSAAPGDGAVSPATSPDVVTAESAQTPAKAGTPTWAWVAGGAGLALLGVAAGFGVDALSAQSDLSSQCSSDRTCPRGFDPSGDNGRKDRGFAILLGAGGAGVAAIGIAIYGISSSAKREGSRARAPSLALAPWIGGGGYGLALGGAPW